MKKPLKAPPLPCEERLPRKQAELRDRRADLADCQSQLVATRQLLAQAERRIIDLAVRNERLEALRREVALAPDLLALAEGFPDAFGALLRFKEG